MCLAQNCKICCSNIWKFSCEQLVSRRNIAQQFLACETVGFEVWFWAQRHSLIQDCPFSSKPLGLNWIISSGCDKKCFVWHAGVSLLPTMPNSGKWFSNRTRLPVAVWQVVSKTSSHTARKCLSHVVSHYHRQVCYMNAASTISMCCLAAKDQTKHLFVSMQTKKALLCMHAVAQASSSFQASKPKLH